MIFLPQNLTKYDELVAETQAHDTKQSFNEIFKQKLNPKEIISRFAINAYSKVKDSQEDLKKTIE